MDRDNPAIDRVRTFWRRRGLDLDQDGAREASGSLAALFRLLDSLDREETAPPSPPRPPSRGPRRPGGRS